MSIVPLCPVHGTPGHIHGAPNLKKNSFLRKKLLEFLPKLQYKMIVA